MELLFPVFVSAVVVAVFAFIFRMNQQKKQIWELFAAQHGLSVTPRSLFLNPHMSGVVDGVGVELETITRGSGNNRRTYTVVSAEFAKPLTPGLHVSAEGLGDRLVKLFGAQDIQLGNREADDALRIKGTDVHEVQELFQREGVLETVMLFAAHGGVLTADKVTLETRGFVTDPYRLEQMMDQVIGVVCCVEGRPEVARGGRSGGAGTPAERLAQARARLEEAHPDVPDELLSMIDDRSTRPSRFTQAESDLFDPALVQEALNMVASKGASQQAQGDEEPLVESKSVSFTSTTYSTSSFGEGGFSFSTSSSAVESGEPGEASAGGVGGLGSASAGAVGVGGLGGASAGEVGAGGPGGASAGEVGAGGLGGASAGEVGAGGLGGLASGEGVVGGIGRHSAPSAAPAAGEADTDWAPLLALKELSPDERLQVIEKHREQTLPVELQVRWATWTTDSEAPEEVRNGQTVVGSLPEGLEVAVLFPKSRDEEVRKLSGGGALQVKVRPLRWDPLYDRLILVAVQ